MARLTSYSVIMPVLNGAALLAPTLDSVVASMAFFDTHHARASEIAGEIVVVDDGSTDGTLEVVRTAVRSEPRIRIVAHSRSFGIGPARNTGARAARGDVVFYCDGDDFFLPEHLLVGFSILDSATDTVAAQQDDVCIPIGLRGTMVLPRSSSFAAVRTGVRLRDPVRPEWHEVIRSSIAQCLCIRRACHDWIEGFPEGSVYKHIGGCEDGAYALAVETFFRVGVIDLETVEHVRRPGNSLDRQMLRFTHPPGSRFDQLSTDHVAVHEIRGKLEAEKIGYLLAKWLVWGPPPLPAAVLNWASVVGELRRRGDRSGAERVAAEAANRGYPIPDAVPDDSSA